MSKFDMTVVQFLESEEYAKKRAEINREINSYPVTIDYSTFKKSKEEKEKTLTMKWANLDERQHWYGKDANKYLNVPSRQLSEPIKLRF